MIKSKKAKKNQKYEEYWKLTLEYTNFKDEKFNSTLKLIIKYIDKFNGRISAEEYKIIQKELYKLTPKADMASIRKAINQFLKLGFVNNGMTSYHKKTKEFLEEKNESRKKRIYSEILYDNASFKRSYSNSSDSKELNFLIKTLEYCGTLSKNNLLALMYQNIDDYPKGYVNLDELHEITIDIVENAAFTRKYNQLNYLYNLCVNVLSGIYKDKFGNITLDRDEQIEEYKIRKGRDPYKQRLYKYDLYRECHDKINRIACYLEDIEYPILIASHIKPYSVCNEDEQFDVNNGLLLSKNIDQLFDQGWISFLDDGSIIFANSLDKKLKNKLKNQSIDQRFLLSKKRLQYLKYHRENIFDLNKVYKKLI